VADREIHGPQQLRWFDHLEYEHDNLRAVLPWALESKQADAGLRLAGELGFFWLVRGYLNEGIGWLERTLAQESEVSKVVAAKAYCQLGSLYMGGVERNPDRVLNVLERSLNLYQKLEDNSGIAWVLNLLGLVAMEHNDYQKAKQFLSQSMILRHELGDPWSIAHSLQNFAPLALQENNYAGAKQITEETSS
jgi:tetratricopeptide (TPR) repeat protein